MSLHGRAQFISLAAIIGLAILATGAFLRAQTMPSPPGAAPPGVPPPPPNLIERLGEHLFRIGQIRVDTAKREVVVPGLVNDAHVLEFVASTKGGFKAYESALALDTGGIPFNAALLLIGLDKTHARVPIRHFDPTAPAGDPVEIWVEWSASGQTRRERVEELMFDLRTRHPIPSGPWVYTGSTFTPDNAYLADIDGVLIGFVHSPAPVIENPRAGAVDGYGSVIFNPNLGLLPGMAVTLTVRALTDKH